MRVEWGRPLRQVRARLDAIPGLHTRTDTMSLVAVALSGTTNQVEALDGGTSGAPRA